MKSPNKSKAKPSIVSRANIATAIFALPLIAGGVLDYVLAKRVEKIRDLIVEQTLPVTLDTMSMSHQLQYMNSNLLEFVLGETEEESEYYEHLANFKEIRKELNNEAVDQASLEKIDHLIDIATSRAKRDVFEFDTASIDKIEPKVVNIEQGYIDPLKLILDEQEQSLLASLNNNERLIKLYALNRQLDNHLNTAANALRLLSAKNAQASSAFTISIYKFELALSASRELSYTPTSDITLNKVSRLIRKLSQEGNALIDDSDTEGYFDAILAIEEIEKHHLPKTNKILNGITEQKRNEVEDSLNELQSATKNSEKISLIVTLLAIITIAVYLYYLRKTIILPIRQITDDINLMREGCRDLIIDSSSDTLEISEINDNLLNFQIELIELDNLRTEQIDKVQKEHLIQLTSTNERLQNLVTENAKANERLKSANTDLEQFVHIASHDLREPLKKLGSLCALLGEDLSELNIDDKNIDDLTLRISEQAASASRLIDDLRLLASLDHKKLDFERCNLDDLIKDVINEVAPMLEGRISSIEIDELPTLTVCKTLFRQVLVNLVRNAILHSEGVFFMAISAQYDTQSENWEFCISNSTDSSGYDCTRLLLPFVKGSRSVKGTGMGLAICKKIIELHSGTIWIEDPKDKKFTVKFRLIDASRGPELDTIDLQAVNLPNAEQSQ